MRKLSALCIALALFLLTACVGGTASNLRATASPTLLAVNGFGSQTNHVHSLIMLPDEQQTLLLATHDGIFRSQDHGTTWKQTAAGPDQLMQGLMTYSLSYNPLNPQRLYVLTQIATAAHVGTLGLYTSGNGGQTWQLALPDTAVPSGSMFFAQAGNDVADQVYIYINDLGPLGLRVSADNGQHFAQAGSTLPFSNILGLLPIPGEPGHLLIYGNNGIARTTDDGQHWQIVNAIQGGIFEMTTSGSQKPIYAEGDAGVYVSHDDGQTFTLVYTQHAYASLTASPTQPQIVYGKLGLGIYRSTDGGQNWSEMPTITNNQQALVGAVLVADPTVARQVYLALSYPITVYHFQSSSNSWQSITPAVR